MSRRHELLLRGLHNRLLLGWWLIRDLLKQRGCSSCRLRWLSRSYCRLWGRLWSGSWQRAGRALQDRAPGRNRRRRGHLAGGIDEGRPWLIEALWEGRRKPEVLWLSLRHVPRRVSKPSLGSRHFSPRNCTPYIGLMTSLITQCYFIRSKAEIRIIQCHNIAQVDRYT